MNNTETKQYLLLRDVYTTKFYMDKYPVPELYKIYTETAGDVIADKDSFIIPKNTLINESEPTTINFLSGRSFTYNDRKFCTKIDNLIENTETAPEIIEITGKIETELPKLDDKEYSCWLYLLADTESIHCFFNLSPQYEYDEDDNYEDKSNQGYIEYGDIDLFSQITDRKIKEYSDLIKSITDRKFKVLKPTFDIDFGKELITFAIPIKILLY